MTNKQHWVSKAFVHNINHNYFHSIVLLIVWVVWLVFIIKKSYPNWKCFSLTWNWKKKRKMIKLQLSEELRIQRSCTILPISSSKSMLIGIMHISIILWWQSLITQSKYITISEIRVYNIQSNLDIS